MYIYTYANNERTIAISGKLIRVCLGLEGNTLVIINLKTASQVICKKNINSNLKDTARHLKFLISSEVA